MNENDELKILVAAALDFAKSLQNIKADLTRAQEQLKNYRIKVLAGLDKEHSAAQIRNDIQQIGKGKHRVKIVGEVDKSATKKNVDTAIQALKNTEIKIAGVLDSAALKQQLGGVPDMSAKVSADVSGTEQIENLRKQMDQAGNSASGMAAKIYLARTALQVLRRAARETIDTIQELDKAATDLAIVTGSSADETYRLIDKYNQMAKELGATTTQISDAAASWLRQGKSAAETTSLIEWSMVLSKVAMMNSEDATKRLTSALNGYKLEAQDASEVVDKLAALDSRAAVTAEDLAIAMSQTASSANIGGVSMNRLLGYITAVQETTQRSAETIGQSFKTIFARIGNIKLGNFLSDDGEDLPDVESVLKNYGVALRNAEGDFRNFGDVLDDVYNKWEQFGAIDKRAVAQAFAGTRQQENFLVLMENYGKALEYAGVAADSSGTALQKFASYADSIEAKANAFTAAVESLTMDTIDSELVKDLIDAGTAVVEFAEKIGILKAALVSLGVGGTLKGIGLISKGFIAAKQNVLNLGTAINMLRRVDNIGGLSAEKITELGRLTKGLTNEQLKLILSCRQLSNAQMTQILTAGGLTEAEAAAKLQTLGLAAAEGTASAATVTFSGAMTGLGTALKAAFASNPVGMTMLAVGAAYELVKGIMAVHDALTVTAEEARETADELHSAFEETESKLESLNTELKTSQSRLEEFQALSDAGTITLVEQEELDNLKEEIGLLERRQRILNEQKKKEAEESDAALVEAFNKQRFDSVARERYTAERDGLQERFDALVDSGDIEAASELYDRISQLNDILASGYDYTTGTNLSGTLGYEEHVRELLGYYRELKDMDLAEMPESQIKFMEYLRDELSNAAGTLGEDWIDKLEVDEETKAAWKKLFDEIYDEIYTAEQITKKLEGLPKRLNKQLTELGTTGTLTADKVNELAGDFQELAAVLDDPNVTAEDVAAHFNALSVSAGNASDALEDAKKSVGSIMEPLNELSEKYELLAAAQKELDEDGGLSNGTLDKLHEQYEAMDDIIALYKLGLVTAQDVYAEYERLYKADERSFVDSNAWKIANTEEYFNKNIKGHKEWVSAIGEYYTADFKNFSELAQKKLELETGLIQKLGENWSKYYSTYASAVKNSYVMLDSAGDFNRSKNAGGMSQYASYSDYVKAETAKQYASWDSATKNAYDNAMALAKTLDSMSELMRGIDFDLDLNLGSSKSGSSSKAVEAYIANIDKYREAVERLRKVQKRKERLDRKLNTSEDMRERILLERQLVNAYQDESAAIQTLNQLRSGTINSNAESLRKLGFEVQYNADTNDLWISNLEHLNELTAKSKGKYGSLQEATNALRKETEELINATASLNEENRDEADSIYELGVSVHDAKSQIVDDLKEIVSQASDAVDEIQNVYDTLKSAAEEYEANGGFISIDTIQSIIKLGPQYMQYLQNENDLLVINEESINRVIEAKTRQLAAEQALTYVERVKAALQEGSIENLNTLLYATTEATDATFGLAYAELELMRQMGELDDTQYAAAMHNIDAIRSLCETAVDSIGKTAGAAQKAIEESKKQLESLRDELEDMQDAGDDIIKYVMDMLKHRIQQQIDLLEEMKDKYSDIIALKKESLRASKDEEDYQKKIKSKLKEMAKLQERIDALGLDDSRSAQAERAKLLEEMAELQEDLNDIQAEKAIEATKDALDKMEEAYHQEKDNEIKILEDSISSYQKLYEMAINYISAHWDTLYSELIAHNTEYGSVLNSEITEAWNNCIAAAQRYGDFVSAMMGGIKNEIASINAEIERMGSISSSGESDAGSPNVVGKADGNKTVTNEDRAAAIIKRMYANMNEHGGSGSSTSAARKAELSQENLRLGAQLNQYGISAYRSTDKEDLGTWYTDSTKREKLFDKYRRYIFHTGGIVGDAGTVKDNEVLAKLEKGESVLTSRMWDNAVTMVDRISRMTEAFTTMPISMTQPILPDFSRFGNQTVSNVTNNGSQPVEIHFGDINVTAGSDSAYVIADEVRKITRENVNQIARHLKIRI